MEFDDFNPEEMPEDIADDLPMDIPEFVREAMRNILNRHNKKTEIIPENLMNMFQTLDFWGKVEWCYKCNQPGIIVSGEDDGNKVGLKTYFIKCQLICHADTPKGQCWVKKEFTLYEEDCTGPMGNMIFDFYTKNHHRSCPSCRAMREDGGINISEED